MLRATPAPPACRDLYVLFALKVLESYNYFRCAETRFGSRLPEG